MPVTNVARFERFFRLAASLDVDKEDLRRYDEFVNHKIHDLLLRAQATARANGRVVMLPFDLPITKGLQQCIHEFRKLDADLALEPVLDELTTRPRLDLDYGDDVESQIPEIAGGLSVALARSFKIVEPALKNPQAQHWQRAFAVFDLLL